MQARRRAQPSGTNSPSSSHPRWKHRARCAIFIRARHAAARVAPERGSWAGSILRAAGERPPRARPQRRGSPGPIPNPAVKPAFAESTAARGCGRAGRRARGGRFSMSAKKARRGTAPWRAFCVLGEVAAPRAAGRAPPRERGRRRRRSPRSHPEPLAVAPSPAPEGAAAQGCPTAAAGRLASSRPGASSYGAAGSSCARVAGAKRPAEPSR